MFLAFEQVLFSQLSLFDSQGVVSPQAFSPYCISKYGVEAFADALRREMRPFDVQVSVIEPGATRTPIVNDELLSARLKQFWDNLTEEKQREYGKQYLENGKYGYPSCGWKRFG